MTRITEELIRRRAEHNECEIFSLEELSLHQQNIERLEHLDKWCRDLKILYLHNNLIPKIENIGRLKKLEYINFTLNNIRKIENLEGCESLRKLDLTINFIADISSVENLKENYNLKELHLVGNPCADYDGYREYVVASLPQLVSLDGIKITKSERILAIQKLPSLKREVLEQHRLYMKNQDDESDENEDVSESDDKDFWTKPSKFTPEARVNIYKQMEKQNKKTEKEIVKKEPRQLITEDGRVMNANQPKFDFEFTDDEENDTFLLELFTYRYLDSSLIDVDVHPNYVHVTVRGKIFQLRLPREVHPDSSKSQRSQTTGHLLVIMPKAQNTVCNKQTRKADRQEERNRTIKTGHELLEVTPTIASTLGQIVQDPEVQTKMENTQLEVHQIESDSFFEDDPNVPPLL